ncbi:hypothetical protein NPX13_g8117 [Xylaria arbuscula]|uniref:Aflatoxin regulatory protein domain-containing protein n=1 Tax=Xylaria arbuscula TaxID=114810 RepID=A0A9W8N9D0_9PEZI|nr:hypothetical protein NPX13_g8117 [Xylaria arbuscula]
MEQPLLYQQQLQWLLPVPEHTQDASRSTAATNTPALTAASHNLASAGLDSIPGLCDGGIGLSDADSRSSTAAMISDFIPTDSPLFESSSFGLVNTDIELPSINSSTSRISSFDTAFLTQSSGSSSGSSRADGPLHPNSLAEMSRNIVPGTCNCRTLAVQQLQCLSVPPDSSGSNDAYFTQLKQAISVSEMCLGCQCITQDDTSMSKRYRLLLVPTMFTDASRSLLVITGTLIGNIIERLDCFITQVNQQLARPAPRSRSSVTEFLDDDSPGRPSSRFWGSLEIEPLEEAELKFHLCLIQLRKLRRILKQMIASVDSMSATEGRENSAKAMAIQCIYVWLVQKVDALKTKNANYSMAGGERDTEMQEAERISS